MHGRSMQRAYWHRTLAGALLLALLAAACENATETSSRTEGAPTQSAEDAPTQPTPPAEATPPEAQEVLTVVRCDDLEQLDVADYPEETPAELVNEVFRDRLFPSGLGDGGAPPGRFGVWELDLYSSGDPSLAGVAELFPDIEFCVHGPRRAADPVDERQDFTVLSSGLPTVSSGTGNPFAVAVSAEELERLASGVLLRGPLPLVDFDLQYVLVVDGSIGTCAWILVALDEVDGVITPSYDDPGYHSCDDHEILRGSLFVALDRPQSPATLTFTEPEGASLTVEIGPRTSSGPAPAPAPADVGDPVAMLERPAPGETYATTLDDGAPVFVVGHLDGDVSVVSAIRPHPEGRPTGDWVSWATGARRFIGIGYGVSGAWDEYGRNLVHGSFADLHAYATEVQDQIVVVGAAHVREPGHPITGHLTGEGGRRIRPVWPTEVHYDELDAVAPGTMVTLNASIAEPKDGEFLLCPGHVWPDSAPPCPADAPLLVDVPGTEPDGRCSAAGWSAPVVVRKVPGGVTDIGTTMFGGGPGPSVDC